MSARSDGEGPRWVANERSGGGTAYDRLRDLPYIRVQLVHAIGKVAAFEETSSTDVGSAKGMCRNLMHRESCRVAHLSLTLVRDRLGHQLLAETLVGADALLLGVFDREQAPQRRRSKATSARRE